MCYRNTTEQGFKQTDTHPLLGEGLPQQQTDDEWKHLVYDPDCTHHSRLLRIDRHSADNKLFDHVLRNGDHVLHELLSERIDISYNLRSHSHNSDPTEEGAFSRKELCHVDAI